MQIHLDHIILIPYLNDYVMLQENYKQLVYDLMAQYGSETKYVFTVPPMVDADADVIQWSTTLVESLKAEGIDAYQYIFELGKVKDHPIASEQRIIAEELCSFLQDNVLNDRISLVNANKLPSNRYIVNGDQIVLKTEVDDVARLYSISGLLVRVASGSAVWSNLPRGYYVLHINSRTAGDVIAKVQVK